MHAPLRDARQVLVRRAAPPIPGEVMVDVDVLDARGGTLAQFVRLRLKRRRQAARETPMAALPMAAPMEALDRLAAQRLMAHLRGRALFTSPGTTIPREAVSEALRLAPRHRRLLAALLELLASRGWIGHTPEGWQALSAVAGAESGWEAAQAALATAEPSLAPHLELLDRCFASLDGILDGSVPATDAFFPGGSMELLTRIYAGDANAAFLHEAVARAVVAAARDAERPARVLEIGAGTGGTSRPVLGALADAGPGVDYMFTDLSPRFLPEARARFGATCPGFTTAVLDIARDPAEQGLEAGGYDVVLAANVLHATPEIRRAVGYAAALLRPGGTLVINEMTAARDYATITFGLLEGWWLAADPELRLPHAPLLSVAQWRSVLSQAGLDVSSVVLPPGLSAEATAPQAVLVARRVPVAVPPAAVPVPPRRGWRWPKEW